MSTETKEIDLVQRLEFLKSAAAGKSVLHLGCTNWPYTNEAIADGMLLHESLSDVAEEIFGFDQDRPGIEILESKGIGNLYKADLEKLEEVNLERTFDVIIAGEMIEHLNNPGLFLEGIKRFMNPDTQLIITTINAYCAMRFLVYGFRGKSGVNEPVHPDHVAYYSYSTLRLLIERHGLVTSKFMFYDIGNEHRPHNRWILNAFNDFAVRISRQLSDGVIAVCGLKNGTN